MTGAGFDRRIRVACLVGDGGCRMGAYSQATSAFEASIEERRGGGF